MRFLRSKVCTSRIEVGGKPGKSTLDLPLLTQLRIYEVFSSWQIKKREVLLFVNSQQSGKKNILHMQIPYKQETNKLEKKMDIFSVRVFFTVKHKLQSLENRKIIIYVLVTFLRRRKTVIEKDKISITTMNFIVTKFSIVTLGVFSYYI